MKIKYLNDPDKFSGDYYVDWIRETLDGYWRGSGNPVVVRHHLVPVLEQIPIEWIEYFLNSNPASNDECIKIIQEYIAEWHLLEATK